MSKVEQLQAELRKLSQTELRQIREWLDDAIEDVLEFTPEFEESIRQAERDLRDLEAAIAENAGKPLVPWQQVKSELDLEFTPEFEASIRQSERDMAEGKIARIREPEGL